MVFKACILRTWKNRLFWNPLNCPKGYSHQICSTVGNRIHVEHEIREFPELVKSDEDKWKIAGIFAEYEAAKNCGRRVPSILHCDQVAELMELSTKSQRMKYLNFLYKKELLINARAKKKVRQAEARKARVKVETEHIRYGSSFNALLPFINRADMKKLYKRHAASGMLFRQDIVVDLDYDNYMAKWESKNCAYQLCQINRANIAHKDPFNVYLCNADRSKATVQYLEKYFPHIWDDYFITCSSSSYLDIFPKEKLVYLSPHSAEVMEFYDHDAVYIIGGFVDKRIHRPISYEKAESEGIRTCRFPLDEHVQWKCGTKSLTLDQVMNILLEMKVNNDWKRALQFVPSRKVKQ